ncbi:4-hydroxybenzoate octaprenyltransferase [Parvularcula bermudensis HTCC2503]|uniref:4-hydroxybenzoate octaprenyltransferase n=1 Tax=Parvularcula bermudensis (strain ATCC BAA-594 / HTCC2503 / KCTC 12087) TaxID=314260 RepID=E0TBW7_PARBH|nr:4-hydroxybenzoate octaprenyltransferase [Parvularcula bermudensis]ADM08460.1 4-hydroxybenzoate octaprenyltransferase [Parvularcula bermudensis HTCC2503]
MSSPSPSAGADRKTPDAAPRSFVDRLPAGMRPYFRLMRADRPVGLWLLFWPCLWGTLIGRPDDMTAPEIYRLWALFLIGSVAMRSAGCIYNDIVDRDIDAQVARTASRPLPSGQVRVSEAWVLLVALCLVGLTVLLSLPLPAILIGLCALVLVAAYPFMKRITWWPQAWLGLTFNWGVLVGGAAVAGGLSGPILCAYAAGLFWTLGYDTIYALQDVEDDALIGVKSSARALGDSAVTGVAVFYGLCVILMAFALLSQSALWGLLLLLPAAGHLTWQVRSLDLSDGDRALRLFKANVWTGLLLALPGLAA